MSTAERSLRAWSVASLLDSPSLVFSDIEALVIALGGSVTEREGSRVRIVLQGEQWRCHRPHPGKEAKRYQVEEVRELLERLGIRP